MRSKFDMQLEELKREMTTMGMLCETAIAKTSQALLRCSPELAAELPELLNQITQKERGIEGICLKLLLHQQPVARDLRTVSSALKMVTDAQRIGTQSTDISEIVALGNIREIPAQRLSDGTVLRLSISHNTIFVLLVGMLQPILIVMAVAAVLSFVLANGLSKRIVEPLNRLNLDEPLSNEGYDELAPLLRRIHSQQQLAIQKNSLAQKQNEFDTIVGQLEEGMILLDKDGRVITANRAAARLLDTKNNVMQGQNLLNLNRNLPLQEAMQEAMQHGSASRKTALRGETIQIQAAAISGQDSLTGVAVVLFDITQAEQAEQRRREFTANVSHELKTPLQSISGYSELLQCGMAKPEDVQPFAGRIYSEAQRLIALVEDIINLSHLDAGTGYEWSQVELYSEAEKVVETLSGIAAEKDVSLVLEGEPSTIDGIPELVHGILYNLCDNAIKYNRPGGTVTVTAAKNTVTVKDTGIGIPEANLDRIFERFYRVDKSRSKEVGGTGLGLSIVKHAAMLMNAKIDVDSKVNVGTEITVTFPENAK